MATEDRSCECCGGAANCPVCAKFGQSLPYEDVCLTLAGIGGFASCLNGSWLLKKNPDPAAFALAGGSWALSWTPPASVPGPPADSPACGIYVIEIGAGCNGGEGAGIGTGGGSAGITGFYWGATLWLTTTTPDIAIASFRSWGMYTFPFDIVNHPGGPWGYTVSCNPLLAIFPLNSNTGGPGVTARLSGDLTGCTGVGRSATRGAGRRAVRAKRGRLPSGFVELLPRAAPVKYDKDGKPCKDCGAMTREEQERVQRHIERIKRNQSRPAS